MHSVNGVEEGHPYYVVAGSEDCFLVNASSEIEDARRAIAEYIGKGIYPQDAVLWVGLENVREMIRAGITMLKRQHGDLPVVSLSGLYCPEADGCLECNRLVSPSGEMLGLGNRAGAKDLEAQIRHLTGSYPGSAFILADDTLFHGETLSRLSDLGLTVKGAAIAFATQRAVQRLGKIGIEVYVGHTLGDDLRDVVPIHDFLPPMPLCGRAVGVEGPVPFLVDGLSFCLPYVLPWITPEQLDAWASIPETHAVPFSRLCLEASHNVFLALRKTGIVRVGDLRQLIPRASKPYNGLTDPEEEITSLLQQALDQLSDHDPRESSL